MDKIEIGNTTLYHGDCREVLADIAGADCLVTDPPYGVNLGMHKASKDKRQKHLNKAGYESYVDTEENLIEVVIPAIRAAIAKTKRGIVFCAGTNLWHFPRAAALGGIFIPAATGRNCWGFTNISPVLLYGISPHIANGCKATGLYSTESSEKSEHPCPKPIGWMKWAVNAGTLPGETVLDFTMGSGSTGVACKNLGRKFIGIEKDEKYFEIACKRIAESTKQTKEIKWGSIQRHAGWSLVCASISEWLSKRTGLPIDFQVQSRTDANKEFDGPRHALGVSPYQKPDSNHDSKEPK